MALKAQKQPAMHWRSCRFVHSGDARSLRGLRRIQETRLKSAGNFVLVAAVTESLQYR